MKNVDVTIDVTMVSCLLWFAGDAFRSNMGLAQARPNDIHISYCKESIGEDAYKLHNSVKLAHCSSERAQIWNIESRSINSFRPLWDPFSNKPHNTRKKF